MKHLDYISSACLRDNVPFKKLFGVMTYAIAGNVHKISKVCGMGVLRGNFNCYVLDAENKYFTSKILVPLEVYNILLNKLEASSNFKNVRITFVIDASIDKESKQLIDTCTFLIIEKNNQCSKNLINEEKANA